MASAETPCEPFRVHVSARFTVAAAVAGPFWPYGTAEQRAAGIETTVRVADHPAMSPGCCIRRASLGSVSYTHLTLPTKRIV